MDTKKEKLSAMDAAISAAKAKEAGVNSRRTAKTPKEAPEKVAKIAKKTAKTAKPIAAEVPKESVKPTVKTKGTRASVGKKNKGFPKRTSKGFSKFFT